MKRGVLFIVIFLTILSGLFAKDKRLYKRKTRVSLLELYETKINDYDYYISAFDWVTPDENEWSIIYSDDKSKLEDYVYHLMNTNLQGLYASTIVFDEAIRQDLTLIEKERDIKNDKFVTMYIYLLE